MALKDRWYMIRYRFEPLPHVSEDARIRAVGFRIVARPSHATPTWVRRGVVVSHVRALALADAELALLAERCTPKAEVSSG